MYKIVQLYSVHKNHSFEQICLPYLAEGTHKEYFAHLCGFGFKFLANCFCEMKATTVCPNFVKSNHHIM